jgi:hypothetical protein
MPVRRILLAVLLSSAMGLTSAQAQAAVLPGKALDTPSTDVTRSYGVDVAPDGTGGAVWIKKVAGVEHVFVSRIAAGAFGPAERVDTALTNPSAQPAIAAANGGRLVVTYINGPGAPTGSAGTVHGALSTGPGQPFADTVIDGDPAGVDTSVDLAPNGNGYMTWTASPGGPHWVYAQHLSGTTWSPVGEGYPDADNAGKLNNDPTKSAGGSGQEPKVAASANGDAVVVFSEGDSGSQETNVFVRRLTGTTRGPIEQASITTLGGKARPTDGEADNPDVDVDDAGNAWVVWREFFHYGVQDVPRALARHLVGNTFEDAQTIDGYPDPPVEGAEFPRVAVNGSGQALAGFPHQLSFQAGAAELNGSTWTPFSRVSPTDSNDPAGTVAALGENGAGAIAWRQEPVSMGPTSISLRTRVKGVFGSETTISDPSFGSADQIDLEAASDAKGNVYVVYSQRDATNKVTVAGAIVDGPPAPAPLPLPLPIPIPKPPLPAKFGKSTLFDVLISHAGLRASTRGTFGVKVRNRNTFTIKGSARLVSTKKIKLSRKTHARFVTLISTRSFTISKSRTNTLSLKLSSANRALLKRLKSIPVTLTLRLTDPAKGKRTVTKHFTLRAPKPVVKHKSTKRK